MGHACEIKKESIDELASDIGKEVRLDFNVTNFYHSPEYLAHINRPPRDDDEFYGGYSPPIVTPGSVNSKESETIILAGLMGFKEGKKYYLTHVIGQSDEDFSLNYVFGNVTFPIPENHTGGDQFMKGIQGSKIYLEVDQSTRITTQSGKERLLPLKADKKLDEFIKNVYH